MAQPRLVIASNSADKVVELRELLAGCGWQIVAASELGVHVDADETGASYLDNARIKAQAFRDATGLPALADDSGLEVDALDGEPGALHHLHGWDGHDQADRIAILLRALRDVQDGERTARFRAVLVLSLPDGRELVEAASCEGVIAHAALGEAGFGYDPVFYMPELGKTMAQLTPEQKNRVSHRALAAQQIAPRLRALVSS